MRKLSKFKVIVNAFTGEVPENEEWYQKRMEICNSCEYNSKNVKDKTILEKIRKALDLNTPHCTACGCYISKKAAMPEESCGLVELYKEPKWKAFMVHTASADDFNVFNNNPEIADLDLEDEAGESFFVLDYGKVKADGVVRVNLLFEGKEKITDIKASCGCTTPAYSPIERGYLVTIGLNFAKISRGGTFRKIVIVTTENKKRYLIRLTGTRL